MNTIHPHPIAVIDLGTNTFHLLIVQPDTTSSVGFNHVFRDRRFVKLGQDGIERISPAAWQRGIDCLCDFRKALDQWEVSQVWALGTAALRTAENGTDFIQEVLAKTGIQIQLIDGLEEAAFILKGVRLAVPFTQEPSLVMDIGGGSVEFIIANATQTFWVKSFPIGVTVLYRNFHFNDPIEADQVHAIRRFLEETLSSLREALIQYPVNRLVGVSGTFDVLENLLEVIDGDDRYQVLDTGRFEAILNEIQVLPFEERLSVEGMPEYRADLIVVAMLLIDAILQMGKIEHLWVSHFSMKQGMIASLMEKGSA